MVESGCSCRFNRQPLDIIGQSKTFDVDHIVFLPFEKKIKRDYFNRWHSHGRNDDFIHRSLERLNYNFELSRFLLFVVYYWGERENRLFCYVSDFFFRVALFINTT
jgi:hypothetical protein